MNTMKMPGFTAEQSLHQLHGHYHNGLSVAAQIGAIIPAKFSSVTIPNPPGLPADIKFPKQSAHVRGNNLFSSRAITNERWSVVRPQQQGAFVVENRPVHFYASAFPGCLACICHVDGSSIYPPSYYGHYCPCCFTVYWG